MHSKAREIYVAAHTAYVNAFDQLRELAETLQEQDLNELADIAFAMRETANLFHALKSRADGVSQTAQNIACAVAVRDDIEKIQTEYCTATPDVKLNAKIPSRKNDPENHATLMRYLGIPDELWDLPEDRKQVVDLHWPGMVELLTKRAEEGRPLPPGVSADSAKSLFRLLMRRRKGVLED